MNVTILIFLSSGLFLGWSLGSNDAANVFGTAVGSRMIRFSTAAIICAVFVTVGAVAGGAGAAHGLGKLGAVNALAGSFTAALAAALTVYWMTKAGLPVSTTQAIVGAIIGWNLYTHSITDANALMRIVGTWIACPILGAAFAAGLYLVVAWTIRKAQPHMFRLDAYTRWGLILAGAFGSYSLGANNIANVMGVFVDSSPFRDLHVAGAFSVDATEQLFLLGGLAVALGVFTYSRRVMFTVGGRLMPLNPVGAWVVVVAHSLVLFIFSSQWLQGALVGWGLPAIPLIPVSSSQAVVGAVIGIGLLKGVRGARQIQWRVLGHIGMGWVTTPVIAAVVCFVMLFFMENVFRQQVYRPVEYTVSDAVIERMGDVGVPADALTPLRDRTIAQGAAFRAAVREEVALTPAQEAMLIASAEVRRLRIDASRLARVDRSDLTNSQYSALEALVGREYLHAWQLADDLAAQSSGWRPATGARDGMDESELRARLAHLEDALAAPVAADSGKHLEPEYAVP